MSIKEKITQLVDIKSESDCSFSVIEDGWIINDVQIKKEEFEELLPLILRDITSEKKRTNFLIVLKKLEKDAITYLPFVTNIVLYKWYEEKKFVHKFFEMINSVTGGISEYIDGLKNFRYLSDLGSLLSIDKQYDLSISCFKKAVKISPSFFFGWVKLSYNLARTGDVMAAVKALWDGVYNNNYDIPTDELQGNEDLKYQHELQTLLNFLQKKQKKNYMLSYVQGLMLSYFDKDYKKAISCFKKSMKLNPLFIESEIQLAKALGRLGDDKGQIKTYKNILKREPKNKRTLIELGNYYKIKADFDLAVHYFKQLQNLEPNNKKWLKEIAYLYRTGSNKIGVRSKKIWDRNPQKSYSYYKKLMAIAPHDEDIVDDFNDLLIELRRFDESKDILFNYMTLRGPSNTFLKKLRSAYSWLDIPFDEKKVLEEINFRRNKDSAYPKIIDLLSKARPDTDIPLSNIAKLIEFPEKRMHELLTQLVEEHPGIGQYIKLEQVFIRKKDTDVIFRELKIKYSTCYYCGKPFDATDLSKCPDCENEILECNLCKLPISFGEDLGECILCGVKCHFKHLQAWVKKHGICPKCLQDITLDSVILVEKEENKT